VLIDQVQCSSRIAVSRLQGAGLRDAREQAIRSSRGCAPVNLLERLCLKILTGSFGDQIESVVRQEFIVEKKGGSAMVG
jgi:hypothetical protein